MNTLLDTRGSYILVKDENEKVWYDPYGIVKQEVGQIISLDHSKYIDGFRIYEVVSHKGNTAVKTKTWSPWTGPTFWMGEALLISGRPKLAWDYFNHNYANSTFCGLLPELMYSKDRPRGIAMPSYSQSAVIRSILYTLGLFHKT